MSHARMHRGLIEEGLEKGRIDRDYERQGVSGAPRA